MYWTALDGTGLHWTAFKYPALHCTVPHCTALHCAVLYGTVRCDTVLSRVLYYIASSELSEGDVSFSTTSTREAVSKLSGSFMRTISSTTTKPKRHVTEVPRFGIQMDLTATVFRTFPPLDPRADCTYDGLKHVEIGWRLAGEFVIFRIIQRALIGQGTFSLLAPSREP